MKRDEVVRILGKHGVQASAQRVAVAQYVLDTTEHPSADQVWERVRNGVRGGAPSSAKRAIGFPMISRATVYNTLNLFVESGLLRQLVLSEGKVVFDPKLDRHHHFVDEKTGEIHDVPWDAVRVSRVDGLPGFEVNEYQVVMRGKKR